MHHKKILRSINLLNRELNHTLRGEGEGLPATVFSPVSILPGRQYSSHLEPDTCSSLLKDCFRSIRIRFVVSTAFPEITSLNNPSIQSEGKQKNDCLIPTVKSKKGTDEVLFTPRNRPLVYPFRPLWSYIFLLWVPDSGGDT